MRIGPLFLAIVGTVSSTVYCLLAVRAAARYKAARAEYKGYRIHSEPITVLKPLHGEDSGLEDNLTSFYQQDHPDFRLLFGARTIEDPALDVVRRLAKRYPDVPTTIVASGEPRWPNARAYAVDALLSRAETSIVVITDSDVRVASDFLTEVVKPIADPRVGLVTCLYRGVSLGGIWSKLEALGMSVELMSNVLLAAMLNGMDFALGPATVTRKEHIERIGGLKETGLYYADDFALGNMIHRSGLKVVLSDVVVEHVVPASSFASSFRHQVLWMKNNRYLRPKGHLGVGLTFAMPYASLGAIWAWLGGRRTLGCAWLLLGVLSCIVRSIAIGWTIVRDHEALSRCWLYPVRDCLGFCVWLATWFGREIDFRGEKYVLLKDGKVARRALA